MGLFRHSLLGIGVVATALAGCDDPKPPVKNQQTLTLPKGENALDSLLSQAPERSPEKRPARLEAVPDRLDFAALPIGRTVVERVQLRNAAGGTAAPHTFRIVGQTSAFGVSEACGSEQAGSCSLLVSFHPSREGVAEAALVIDSEGEAPTLYIPIAGATEATTMPVAPAPPHGQSGRTSLLFAQVRLAGDLNVGGAGATNAVDRHIVSADYREAGLNGLVSTFPVVRARVITADRYIPAVLENSIDSQLPGRAIAVVERNVYGSDDRLVLIPAGSRVVGRYQSLGKAGQARLDIAWSRIIRPDGSSINIDDTAADVMGRAGLPGDLDNRFFEKYGSSLLTSVIGAAGTWALGGDGTAVTGPLGTTQSLTSRAMAANRLGSDFDQLAQRIVQDNVDIRPVLLVPQGTRLNIIPSEDIWLRDPSRLEAVTPPKGRGLQAKAENLAQLIPGLVELLAANPAVQKAAPQTAQQILQSTLLQQLRSGIDNPTANTVATPVVAASKPADNTTVAPNNTGLLP